MAALGAEIFTRGFRFNPTPLEAATCYLPRLIAGAPLHDVVRPVVHHANVYAREPGDLARQFRPMPKAGDRFFFSSCSKEGVRVAGPGSWYLQSTKAVKDGADQAKVGEVKKFRYRKGGVFTDWLMDEFSTLCSEEAAGGDRPPFVFCKIYVSPRAAADSAARQESAAFFAQAAPSPAVVVTQVAALKRPAPQSAEPHCPKRMRVAIAPPTPPVVQPHGCGASFASCAIRIAASAPTRLAAPPPSRSPARALQQPLVQPKQQMPPPTPPVSRFCSHIPVAQSPARHCPPKPSEKTKQRIGDLFEAIQQIDEAEEERVAASDSKESPLEPELDEDDDWDELEKCVEVSMPTADGSTMTQDEMHQHVLSLLEDEEI